MLKLYIGVVIMIMLWVFSLVINLLESVRVFCWCGVSGVLFGCRVLISLLFSIGIGFVVRLWMVILLVECFLCYCLIK